MKKAEPCAKLSLARCVWAGFEFEHLFHAKRLENTSGHLVVVVIIGDNRLSHANCVHFRT